MTDIIEYGLGFLPVLVRITGLVMAAPIFGGRGVPNQVKMGLSALIALVIYPVLAVSLPETAGMVGYGFIIAGELFIGICLGFAVTLVFSAIYLAGQLIDVPMGFGMVNVVDPQSGLQVPIFAQFQYILASLIFLAAGGHRALFQALSTSFILVPVGGFVGGVNTTVVLFDVFVRMFYLGIKLSLPIITGILLADVALGIVARAVPQINIFVVGFPAKILIGISLFVLVLPAYVTLLVKIFGGQGEVSAVLRRILGSF
ncbi:MAG: flagellar type III secretion system protein FliR [Firmicutes bacterium]|nr:flagellar type III secretion system protein FliR [Bacillota bacterium]